MFDLAEIGMMLVAGGSTIAAVCATTMWLDTVDQLRIARRELATLRTPVILTTDDIVRPHVMCGACGVSAPVEADGFTIAEHNCAMDDLFSHDDLRS